MNGVITKYFEDKGYGFITGEDDKSYFFHISKVSGAHDLTSDIYAFLCPSLMEENCRAVEFLPESGSKGMTAIKIRLLDDIVNDIHNSETFEAEITDVVYNRETLSRIVTGIKKGSAAPIFATAGSNGTYRLGYPEVYRFLVISFRRKNKLGWGKLECHKEALQANGRSNMTDSFVGQLKTHLAGRTILIYSDGEHWRMKDNSLLII